LLGKIFHPADWANDRYALIHSPLLASTPERRMRSMTATMLAKWRKAAMAQNAHAARTGIVIGG
jgi:hypothetical protein